MTFESMLSPMLKPGDRVRLVSPASFTERAWVEESLAILERWGLVGEVGSHALDRFGYMAGTDDDRLADLNDAFRDPGVRAIVTTGGGAGAYRIADKIDFAAVSADPKPVVGFSDITAIHLALMRHCGLASIHGCLFGEQCQPSVRQLLMTTDPVILHRDPDAVSATFSVQGQARGPLIGGNLALLATSVGVRVPDLTGAILFLEDQRVVGLGTIDRQLTQSIASGTLDGVAGIALGSFEAFRGYTAAPGRSPTSSPIDSPPSACRCWAACLRATTSSMHTAHRTSSPYLSERLQRSTRRPAFSLPGRSFATFALASLDSHSC